VARMRRWWSHNWDWLLIVACLAVVGCLCAGAVEATWNAIVTVVVYR
jgi:predicted negative regulator of RcsB-dependent stress response